tara:strand:+ start:1821 stop:2585 length:765 start_codon:yes stop_codon:yes gene_type:complete
MEAKKLLEKIKRSLHNHSIVEGEVNRVDRYLGSEGSYKASMAGQCYLKHWFAIFKPEEAQPIPKRSLRIMRLGTIIHDEIETAIKEFFPKESVITEGNIELKEFKVRGHYDLLYFDSKESAIIVDFKTMGSFPWKTQFGRDKRLRHEKSGYNLQLATYAMGVLREFPNIKNIKMLLIYYNKDTSAMQFKEVDQSWITKAKMYWGLLNTFMDEEYKFEPEDANFAGYYYNRTPIEDWECRYCSFNHICEETNFKK